MSTSTVTKIKPGKIMGEGGNYWEKFAVGFQ
jgi:hypothetical protein